MKWLWFDEHGNPNRACSIGSYLLTALIIWIPLLLLIPQVWTIAVALVVARFLYQQLPWMTPSGEVESPAEEAERAERYRQGFARSKTHDDDTDESGQ